MERVINRHVGVRVGWILLMVSTGCDSEAAQEIRIIGNAWTVGDVVAQRVATLEPDLYGLSHPQEIELHGDTLVVLDAGNDRVVLFDAQLRPLLEFGRGGAGPGELEGPIAVERAGEEYLVFDPANQRISRFGLDGSFRAASSVKTSVAAQTFAVGSDGDIYIPHPWPDHLLVRIGADGHAEPFGERPDSARLHPTGVSFDQVVVTAGDTLHLLDWQRRLYTIAPSGRVLAVHTLPARFIARSEERRRDFERSLGGQSVVTELPPDLTITADGELLISDSDGAGSIGLIVDPRSYQARVIRVPEGHPLRHLRGAALRDSTLFTLTMGGIRVYRLQAR